MSRPAWRGTARWRETSGGVSSRAWAGSPVVRGPRARVRSSRSRTGWASASSRSGTVSSGTGSGGPGSATGYCTTGCQPGAWTATR
ncbi:hypothetical protein HDC93_002815 [Streptomyces sp. AK010]|nr:hypothetical protein [Streptomyces sp. AK010]